jgi:UTP--glucose-1-phosphate uridylyltransferase
MSDNTEASKTVTKAVIPAAGMGTRLEPLTNHLSKELLPVGGKPMIQHTIEMCMASGISELCIITSPNKPLLNAFVADRWRPPHLPFQRDPRFYGKLAQCNVSILTQEKARGVADAVSLARGFVGNDPFVCIMPDCLLFSHIPFARQLKDVFNKYKKPLIGTVYLQGNDARHFGNVGRLSAHALDKNCVSIRSLSDKTRKPLSVDTGEKIHKGFGGGIYLPEYFDLVEIVRRGEAKGEIDDVPIHHMLIQKEALLGVILQGTPFDVGHPLGYRAAVHFAGRLHNGF